jgi:hypothetical protein
VQKLVDGVPERGWLYQDALNPVAEVDGSGAITARFVFATRSYVPDYILKGGHTYRVIADHLVHRVRNRINAGTVVLRHDEPTWIDQADGKKAG